ncbi:hypothetical protein Pelo_5142 [Pelomyxa schiedti]|nr:hypothetical protein Pelo_5142 [Pelomyxa schiedti]
MTARTPVQPTPSAAHRIGGDSTNKPIVTATTAAGNLRHGLAPSGTTTAAPLQSHRFEPQTTGRGSSITHVVTAHEPAKAAAPLLPTSKSSTSPSSSQKTRHSKGGAESGSGSGSGSGSASGSRSGSGSSSGSASRSGSGSASGSDMKRKVVTDHNPKLSFDGNPYAAQRTGGVKGRVVVNGKNGNVVSVQPVEQQNSGADRESGCVEIGTTSNHDFMANDGDVNEPSYVNIIGDGEVGDDPEMKHRELGGEASKEGGYDYLFGDEEDEVVHPVPSAPTCSVVPSNSPSSTQKQQHTKENQKQNSHSQSSQQRQPQLQPPPQLQQQHQHQHQQPQHQPQPPRVDPSVRRALSQKNILSAVLSTREDSASLELIDPLSVLALRAIGNIARDTEACCRMFQDHDIAEVPPAVREKVLKYASPEAVRALQEASIGIELNDYWESKFIEAYGQRTRNEYAEAEGRYIKWSECYFRKVQEMSNKMAMRRTESEATKKKLTTKIIALPSGPRCGPISPSMANSTRGRGRGRGTSSIIRAASASATVRGMNSSPSSQVQQKRPRSAGATASKPKSQEGPLMKKARAQMKHYSCSVIPPKKSQ